MTLAIRPALPADAAIIASYNAAMARETEHLELDGSRLAHGVAAVLRDPSKGLYFLAEADGAIAGQMMITFEWSDWRNVVFWWIQSVYVHPDHRNRGVFRRLYEHVLAEARSQEGVCGLRLYVERGNAGAQQVYQRLGMKRASYEFYEVDFVISRSSD